MSQAHERALTRRADEGFAKRSLGLVSCKVANTRPRHRREGCSRFRDAGTEAPRGTVARPGPRGSCRGSGPRVSLLLTPCRRSLWIVEQGR